MRKRRIYKAFIAIFMVACLVPVAALPLVGEAEPAANEIPVTRPRLLDGDGINADFPAQLTDYIATRFAFRQELVTAWATLNAKLFNSSAQQQLVLGKDDWLFFSETLEDYMGLCLSDGQLQNAANNLSLIQEYAESHGADFLFTIAPNKNSLYPEFMPERIAGEHSASNAERLLPRLRETGVNSVDLFSAFQGQDILYYAGDSHWNSRGAALAADSLLTGLGRESGFFEADFRPGKLHTGDLFEMLYPAGSSTERDLSSDTVFTYACVDDPAGGNAMNIYTENPEGVGRLLCFRDSFGIALYPYLAQSFESARFTRAADYDLSAVTEKDYDAVIIELVERNIDYLVDRAPSIPAPRRELPQTQAGEGSVVLDYRYNADQSYAQAYGELGASMLDEGSRIYLFAGEEVYEAFVLRAGGDTGFSAWLPPEARVDALVCSKGGSLTTYMTINK